MRRLALLLAFAGMSACSTQAVSTGTPTPVVRFAEELPTEISYAVPTPTPQPFSFNLPTPGAAPVSGWRPPLYPVPLAVSPYDHFYFARPIAADQVNWPLAEYRYGGIFTPPFIHTGVDIDAPQGTPILAAGPGTVVWSDWGLLLEAPGDRSDPYGQAIVIRMDFGYQGKALYSVYAHMSRLIAVVGQRVETGDTIGLVGTTGNTTGPHLHFEVRWGQDSFHHTYNPELWTVPPEGQGVLVGYAADTDNKSLQQLEVSVRNEATGQTRVVKTYGPGPVNHDPYYDENLVLGDLPAGLYKVFFNYSGKDEQFWLSIYAGQVTYFTFRGDKGFSVGAPTPPKLKFIPAITPTERPTPTLTPTPPTP